VAFADVVGASVDAASLLVSLPYAAYNMEPTATSADRRTGWNVLVRTRWPDTKVVSVIPRSIM